MSTLRELPALERAEATRELALAIRAVPSVEERLALGSSLANLSTEGDNGQDTLQAVADTLAEAIGQYSGKPDVAERAYAALARLAHYENVRVELDDPPYQSALAALEQIDQQRQSATFSLEDLTGKQWSLADLRGKVVLVNFWATWCPPCRKEMPDMDALYRRFRDQGLVVLAISDEEAPVVRKFLDEHPYTFPILLDPGGTVKNAYLVQGIPNSFVYNREGRIVATGADQRTERQFLEMLAKAGLR
jgi:peroxiredoxin